MIDCPECNARHYPGTLFCDECGAAVHPAAQAHVAAARPAAVGGVALGVALDPVVAAKPAPAPAPAKTPTPAVARPLLVRLPHHDAEFIFQTTPIRIGRADPEAGFAPELDLSDYGGLDRGVSRRHATIEWVEGHYVIIDRHSSNGTWLDGLRLVAGYAYQLPPRATVRFGGLVVQLAVAD